MELKPKVGVGVIVLKGNQVLLGKRLNSHGSGDWAFPGGHLEYAETPEDCARRELMEETALKPLLIRSYNWTNDLIDQKHYVTLFMVVSSFEGSLTLCEPHKCERWDWFNWDKLPEPLFPPVHSLIEKEGISNLAKLSD